MEASLRIGLDQATKPARFYNVSGQHQCIGLRIRVPPLKKTRYRYPGPALRITLVEAGRMPGGDG